MEDDVEFTSEADAMHALMVQRVNDLADSHEGTAAAAELVAIVAALVAYEAKRWPLGKVAGRKRSGQKSATILTGGGRPHLQSIFSS
jgi:hypothetical protein